MIKFKDIKLIKEYLRPLQRTKTIGFVPTMGYLHEGHLSLLRKARQENDIVVLSIFLNPTQFAPNEDLDKYPKDLDRDLELAESVGTDIVFFPSETVMYPEGYKTYVEVNDITKVLCGESRPTHFKGVTTVVTKLFNIVNPNKAYFGQKDAQQCLVIKQMVKDLNMDVDIVVCPIIREQDGLAMSSRNTYLNTEERTQALVLNESLQYAKQLIAKGERNALLLKDTIKEIINKKPLANIDYIEIVDTNSLNNVSEIQGEILIALAVRFGATRLIDNIIVEV